MSLDQFATTLLRLFGFTMDVVEHAAARGFLDQYQLQDMLARARMLEKFGPAELDPDATGEVPPPGPNHGAE